MRALVVVLALVCAVPEVHAQVVISDVFRSLSGFIRGGKESQQQQGATPVMGVRGIDETGETASAPASGSGDFELMEGWSATKIEAEHAAEVKGIVARPASFKKSATGSAAPEGGPR
jgi:hypothetical protein